MMFDYTKAPNETAAKKMGRADLTQLLLEFLVEKFGEENVGLVENNTIGLAFGDVIDKDGCPVYMVATIKPTIKNYQAHGGENRPCEAYDFDQARKDYAEEMAAKKK